MCFVPATFEIVTVGIALSMGLSCGGTILAIAVLAIVLTPPIEDSLIDIAGKKWLSRTSLDTETVNQTNKNRQNIVCVVFRFYNPIKRREDMKTIGNILWVIFGGLEMAIAYFFIGLIWCITIIGIPVGKQYFKLAKLCFMPFGAEITK